MKTAFSLIELLVVVAVIGILSSVSIVALGQLSSRSRDSSRKESLAAYATSLEQYKTSNGHYIVDATLSSITSGYRNEGWGRLTRKLFGSGNNNHPDYYTSNSSIADILQQKGYLTAIQTDPLLRGLASNADVDGTSSDQIAPTRTGMFTHDFFLLVCGYDKGQVMGPVSPSNSALGKEFALYANLENLPPNGRNSPGTGQCGSNFLSAYGDGGILGSVIQQEFNYVVGSSL